MPSNPESGLWLGELLEINDEYDQEIEFDWSACLPRFRNSIREIAVYCTLRDREGRIDLGDGITNLPPQQVPHSGTSGEGLDRDFMPPPAIPGWQNLGRLRFPICTII